MNILPYLKISLLFFLILPLKTMAGEFDDHCTAGLAIKQLVKTTCEINEVFEGKKYCFGTENSHQMFLKDPKTLIKRAENFYANKTKNERKKMTQQQANEQIANQSCDFSDTDLGYLDFKSKDLRHCKMVNVSFFGADLRYANLSGTDLTGAYLNLARLEHTDLSQANLTEAIIFQAIFDHTNFAKANLTAVRLIGTLGAVNMEGVQAKKAMMGLDIGNQPMGRMNFDSIGGSFINGNFEEADLSRSTLTFSNFTEANLHGVNFFRSDLNKVNFTGADLSGANFTEAEIEDAIFTNAKGVSTIKGRDSVKGKGIAFQPN